MFLNHFGIVNLKTIQRRKSLHFYQLGFEFLFFIYTNTEIKSYEMECVSFSANKIHRRNGFNRIVFETGCCDNIYNGFAGADHFFPKIVWHEYGGFCNSEFNGTRMFCIQVVQKGLIFFFCEGLIKYFSEMWNHI